MTEEEWLAATSADPLVGYLWARDSWPRDSRWRLFCVGCCRLVPALRALPELDALERGEDIDVNAVPANARDLFGRVRESSARRVMWLTGLALGAPSMDFTPHVPVVRCIFGNPFRPIASTPPPHVAALATTCAAHLPDVDAAYAVLGDALEELGEHAAAAHCRTALHVRGCHVIDWALAKR